MVLSHGDHHVYPYRQQYEVDEPEAEPDIEQLHPRRWWPELVTANLRQRFKLLFYWFVVCLLMFRSAS